MQEATSSENLQLKESDCCFCALRSKKAIYTGMGLGAC